MQRENKWQDRFDEEFGDNVVWWQECLAEMQIGDPDFNRLKSFIQSEIDRAVAEERRIAAKIVEEMMEDHEYWQPIANRILGEVKHLIHK